MKIKRADADQPVADHILDFLYLYVELILAVCNVYPPYVFEQRQQYGVKIYSSVSAVLNEYLVDVLSPLRPWISSNLLTQFIVVIKQENSNHNTRSVQANSCILAKYVLDLEFPTPTVSAHAVQELEDHFYSILCRIISNPCAQIEKWHRNKGGKSQNLKFQIVVYCKQNVANSSNGAWILASKSESEEFNHKKCHILPLKDSDDRCPVRMSLSILQVYESE